ncbi:hypothetical protein HBO01_07400 [Pseudomonas rhodesiae]|uniref:hypothetical protein n=1 Tax=Pseudomonas rhodesiae TaxID=76760 RepID=UPI0014760DE5|nr:hypothetical protein [Pseudomonas rhodesiae]NMY78501.1 hypothetical protein [Pseudomonas rhodesiae]
MSDINGGALSSDEVQVFFADNNMQKYLAKALDRLEILFAQSEVFASSEGKKVHDFIKASLNEMTNMPAVFDSSCSFNIKHIGSKFVDCIQAASSSKNYDVDTLLSSCYRFVVELELKSPNGMSQFLNMTWNEVSDLDFREFPNAATQVKWSRNNMAISILREYINHPHMAALINLPAAIRASEEAREKSNDEMSIRELRVNALQDKLKGYENAYNFVGLYQGFSKLREDKAKERDLTFKFLMVLGFSLLLVPLLKLFGVVAHEVDLIRESLSIAALFALELMIIYFFRIALQNFRSIKAQLLQIDLRMTLCQFINSYVEFASDARKSDKELLAKFEQVIFSGIVSDESVIPSTFDGLEQVAKIVDGFKPR